MYFPDYGYHRGNQPMMFSLLLKQCLACLDRLIWMLLEMGGEWPNSCCFMRCCFESLFSIASCILV